ncbi:MAG: hypothetical protein Q7S09_01065, partial [bacterium]|nr:hypothetical protein [bacterium]
PPPRRDYARKIMAILHWSFRRLRYWYVLVPLIASLVLLAVLPVITRYHREAESLVKFSETLNTGVLRLHALTQSGSEIKRRDLLAELQQAFVTDDELIPANASSIQSVIAEAIRRIDQETMPSDLEIVADFNQFSVAFSPELILESDTSYYVSEKDLVQLIRMGKKDMKPRLVITGLAGNEDILAVAKTLEDPQRFAYITPQKVYFLEPGNKSLLEQKITLPKGMAGITFFVSGAKEVFAVSAAGPVGRKLITSKISDQFRSVTLPMAFQQTHWRAASVIPPSLYLLTEDSRLIQITAQKLTSDTVIDAGEPLNDRMRMRALEQRGLLAVLDESHSRVILMKPNGEVVRQFRHELFTEMRDIITTSDNTMLLLTATHVLEFTNER